MAKFKQNRQSYVMLLPPSIEDFIPESHFARVVSSIVDELDTNSIENKYSHLGQNTYHPKILLKILFYGYATGIRSGRKLSMLLETDTAFMYLSQMYKPDFRTINDFRKNNASEIEGYFVDIVKICKNLGMIKLGSISVDGSKIRANAAATRTRDKKGYEEWLEKIKGQIKDMLLEADYTDKEEDRLYKNKRGDELPKKLEKKDRLRKKIRQAVKKIKDETTKVNLTDNDAKYMKDGSGKIKLSYNGQISVSDNQIIVAADITSQANDRLELKSMIEKTEENTSRKVREVLADAGYSSYDNYEYLNDKNIDGYIPDDHFSQVNSKSYKQTSKRYHHENFMFDKNNNCYICPEGKNLKFYKKRISDRGKIKRRQVIYRGSKCHLCMAKPNCTTQKQRTVARELRQELLEDMREKLLTDKGKQKYKKRMHRVEPPFGHLKHNLGYKMFHLRSLKKVRSEFKLMCIGYNLRKIWKYQLVTA